MGVRTKIFQRLQSECILKMDRNYLNIFGYKCLDLKTNTSVI